MVSIEAVLKALLKAGLEAAEPFVGGVVVRFLKEISNVVPDEKAIQRLDDLQARLLMGMQNHAKILMHSGEMPHDIVDHIVSTAEDIIRRHGLHRDEWTVTNFSADRATSLVFDRSGDLLVALSDDEKSLCRLLLHTFHVAFFDDRFALMEAEPEFRRAVLERLERLPQVIANLSAEQADSAMRLAAAALVEIPYLKWRREISPPGALLRAEIGAVPFHGREKETKDISAWCEEPLPAPRADPSPRNIGIRLYTGAGGMGKTRLFIEQCLRLRAQGWVAGFLQKRSAKDGTPAACQGVWRMMVHQDRPLFLVVDYAESRRPELVHLLRQLFRGGEKHPVRIILLARAAGVPGDWWDRLKTEGDGVGDLLSGPATAQHSLEALATTREDREASYWKAVVNFCKLLEKPAPIKLPEDMEANYYERVLILHMSALNMIEGVHVKGKNPIIDCMYRREQRYWNNIAEQSKLPETVVPGIGLAMAVITEGGGAVNEAVAIAILEHIPFLGDQPRANLSCIARILHNAYPSPDKWIEPIQPDLLAEHLILQEYKKNPDVMNYLTFGPAK